MRAWPLMMLLALVALAGPRASASTPLSAQAQSQGKDPTAEELAEAAGAPLIGKFAPPVTLSTLDGRKIDLTKFYGRKPVYLKFWATWCVPCRLQMPHFENVERTLGDKIEVVAVNAGFNETKDAVRRYRETLGLTMPIVIDDGRLADALHLRVTPQHIVIGRDGRILHVGHLADTRLDKALAQAIAEPAATYSKGAAQRGTGPARTSAPPLTTLAGDTLSLHDSARPTVVFFFSPWCESYLKISRPEMAESCRQARDQVAQAPRAPGVRWVGVAAGLWATQKDLAAYQRDHPLQMPLALDETGAVFRSFGISDVPAFVVLDRKGRVVARAQRADQANRAAAQARSGRSPAKEL